MIVPLNESTNDFMEDLPLLSDELAEILGLSLVIPINCIVSLTGILANILNVIILSKLDFNQSMSYGTMTLSLTDLTVSCLQLTSEILYVLHYVLDDSVIDFMSLSTLPIGWMRYTGLNISGWITALIATERCFCVVIPFHVKRLCTRPLYIIALVAIYCVYFGFVIPVIILERFTWQPLPADNYNATVHYVLTVAVDDTIVTLEKLLDSICVFGFALLSQIVLLVSTICMVSALRETARVRTSTDFCSTHRESTPGRSSLSVKEKRLIRVAVWLAVVMFVCSIPRYICVAFFAVIPTEIAERNVSLTNFLVDVSDIFININSFSTFIVYFSLHENFKNMFYKLFCSA
ncbi:neuromedin-U receptor 2 [Biomphalaria glabrata]|nr:neuromedin-U receptor 2-like [Biomphalaria glabrata]